MPEVITVMAREGAMDTAVAERTRYGATNKVRLFKEGFAPTPASAQADFIAQEATYHGYVAVVVVAWDPVYLGSDGNATFSNGTSLFFQNDDGTLGHNVGGAWLETTGGKVQDYCIFEAPVPMVAALAAINMEWLVKFPGPGSVSYDF